MELEKVKIKRHIPPGEEFSVLFNPGSYRLTAANQFVEVAAPGLRAPLIQFGRGSVRTLSMQLFFDSYEEQKDVRDYTRKITNLLETERELHAPPVCLVSWGGPTFVGVLEQANTNFTFFLPSGRPVRATIDVTFKEFPETTILEQLSRQSSSHFEKEYVVKAHDTLSSIAGEFLGDPRAWRAIAERNDLENPLALTIGQALIIPATEGQPKVLS